MRIVNRKEFLSLPSGIIYSYYRSHGFEGLYEKGEAWANDWIYADMIDNVDASGSIDRDRIIFAAEEGATFHMDLESGSRDGTYNDEDMFAIYDKNDMSRLVLHLKNVLDNYPIG